MQETIDYIALRRLQNRYADLVTRRAWSELHEVFRADCVVTVDVIDRSMDFDGPRAIGDFISGQLEQFDFFEFLILNTVMKIDADAGTARARMYIQELRQNVSDGRRSDSFGVYHDRFDRDEGGRWWFAERHYQSFARTNPVGSPTEVTVFPLSQRDL
ncbi:MAG: nuclear transport factor 2 family protein [bacterium]|nr:nuclear transport factor 2 family protein [bacterium]